MRHIKNFNSYKPVNEGLGLALLAGVGLAMFAPALYDAGKKFWSKNVVGSKYTETGNKKQVVCKFDRDNVSYAVSSLTESERQSGQTTIELKEYKDMFGNIYYGYDHVISDEIGKGSLYTAMYKAEDWATLESWLADGKRYEGRGSKLEVNPVDLIWVDDVKNVNSSGTPISQ